MTIEKRIERIEAILDARGLDWDHPRVGEPVKEPEPEHRAGPKPDPGEGYRLLSKDPPEELAEGDDFWFSSYSEWHKSFYATLGITSQCDGLWFRRKIEPPKPAWEPKVGDWVLVTRPENWKECAVPSWSPQMHQYDGKVGKIESEWEGRFHICGFAWPNGLRFVFDRDWLSPAEPPKPPEPEYREPVLPADFGKPCEFSDDSISWEEDDLFGWSANLKTFNWESARDIYRYARIKVDA